MAANNFVGDTQILVLDVEKLKQSGMSISEFTALVQMNIYPNLDVYRVLDKKDALTDFVNYSK